MSNLLEVKDLYSYYGGICALHGVSLNVRKGEITSIIGANGAGKSTLMRTIAGDKAINQGTILFEGKPISDKVHEVVASGISLVPEGRRIFQQLTARALEIERTKGRTRYFMGTAHPDNQYSMNIFLQSGFSIYKTVRKYDNWLRNVMLLEM